MCSLPNAGDCPPCSMMLPPTLQMTGGDNAEISTPLISAFALEARATGWWSTYPPTLRHFGLGGGERGLCYSDVMIIFDFTNTE